jgi:hypothetical protein
MIKVEKIQTAYKLNNNWNSLCSNYFQTKEFLIYCEKYNYCTQRYYELYFNNKIECGLIMYSIRMDLLTYLKIKSPLKMNIVGIPASVSASGIMGNTVFFNNLKEFIYKNEKGFILFLNMESESDNQQVAKGRTLPSIIFQNIFNNWGEYIQSLKSNYRRRISQILKNDNITTLETTSCTNFKEINYNQYLQVYNKSDAKLEKLNFEFFKNLPDNFSLTNLKYENEIIGWNITTYYNNFLYFFLGGIEYKYNEKYNTYFRLLLNIIKEGIEKKVEFIDLGQTAETPKQRLGGEAKNLFMEAKHSKLIFNKILKLSQKSLSYKKKLEKTNAFNVDYIKKIKNKIK